MPEEKEVRATYTREFIRVYQAFNSSIADSALKNNQFISPPFKTERTTWIKPSFLWMMYRSGWATKKDQERILAIDMKHTAFLWALDHSCISHFNSNIYKSREEWEIAKDNSVVVVQWDPERDIFLKKLDYRSIQIGLTPPAAKIYATEWIIKVSDITDIAQKIKSLIDEKRIEEVAHLLPLEKKYLLPGNINQKIGIN